MIILIKTWNGYLSIKINGSNDADFASSLGMMGSYPKSIRLARDNETIIDNVNLFGQEWQVLPTEDKLFHNVEGPQAPEQCEIPSAMEMRRRLGESVISQKDAKVACSRVSIEDFDMCVFDVMATNDKDSAGTY